MQVSIERNPQGAMVLHLDREAATAVLACVTFASQFHPKIALLSRVTEESLAHTSNTKKQRDKQLCR